MIGHTKITRAAFYNAGGFANPRCVRVSRGASYAYYFRGTP